MSPLKGSDMSVSPSRREVLRGALGIAAGAALGVPTLAACSSGPSSSGTASNAKATLPAYVPYAGSKPDLPGNAKGLAEAYFKYPAQLVKGVAEAPGDGSAVSALVESPLPVPPGKSQNRFWQAVNQQAKIDLSLTISPTSDWVNKFATVIAGGDIPDLVEVWTPPQRPDMMPALFQDLSEFVSGDAIKDYPFLANIESASWQQCVYKGGIYGVPVPRGAMSSLIMFRRDDLIKQRGVNPDPKNFAEFKQLCVDLTDTGKNKWALGGVPHEILQQMLGLPAGWKNEGGKLTSGSELPEMKNALSAAAELWKAGVIQPDSFSANVGTLRKQWFNSGVVSLVTDTYPAWPGYYRENTAGASFDIGAMKVPGYDGGDGTPWKGNPTHNITALKKASPERIKMLLRLCNWLAAPLGTQEHLLVNFGVEGVHFERQNGEPILNSRGIAETALSVGYLAAAPRAFYQPGLPDVAKKQHAHQQWLVEKAVSDPTLGLTSQTASRKAEQLDKKLSDLRDQIVQGKQPVDAWDEAVKQWRSGGGDQIRTELQEALQAAG
jgi:putative aldouronate transport system substrate-binding protein